MTTYREIADNEVEADQFFAEPAAKALRDNPISLHEDFVGAMLFFGADTPPTRTLECDGSAVSRTTYSQLFNVLNAAGLPFGNGDGSTTFNLPDLRGEFPRGWDNGRGVDSGRVFGSAQGNAVQSHSHGNGSLATPMDDSGNLAPGTGLAAEGGSGQDSTAAVQGSTANTGSSETRPRNVAAMWVIVYKGDKN